MGVQESYKCPYCGSEETYFEEFLDEGAYGPNKDLYFISQLWGCRSCDGGFDVTFEHRLFKTTVVGYDEDGNNTGLYDIEE